MMRRSWRSSHAAVSFNMTPMIDVVFLLIIFFLVSSHLASQESRLALPLPSAATGEQPAKDQVRVTLHVLRDGTILQAGHALPTTQLISRLKQLREEHGQQIEIRIRADRSVPYRHVGPLLAATARAQIWNVTFAVVPAEESL